MRTAGQAQERVGPRRGRGRPRRWTDERTSTEQRQQIRAWFAGRLPEGWYSGPPSVEVDHDEILVVGELAAVELAEGATDEERSTAEAARIGGHREDTRERRMRIAEEAQAAFGRRVSWGATCGATTAHFTTASVPVMTRLRMPERLVLDTLVDAGVARSRSEALAWCVRLVGAHEDAWISDLRAAFQRVEEVRSSGPRPRGRPPRTREAGRSGHRGEGAGQVLDAVDEVGPQPVGLGRGADVGQPGEQLAEHHRDLPPGQVGAEAEVGPGGPEPDVRVR